MPAIADPGSAVVQLAHKNNYRVVPLVGPSSIFLALAASGLNGQSFSFNGYLPIKEAQLNSALKVLEKKIIEKKETQIFIETPYRNNRILEAMLNRLSPQILLCLAIDVTGTQEQIVTKSIKEWKNQSINLEKVPTIFLLGL